jgi:hypothetical protein
MSMRPTFDRHVDRLARKHIEPARRKEIEMIAFNLFGSRFRRPIL